MKIRSLEEHVARALALHAVIACSFGFPRDRAKAWIATQRVDGELTEDERNFLAGDEAQLHQRQADVHCLYALVWALSVLPTMTLDGRMPDDLVNTLPDLWKQEPSGAFRSRVVQRSDEEILGVLDLAYCLHWSLVDAQMFNPRERSTELLLPVSRRRHALEWLASSHGWDEIELNT